MSHGHFVRAIREWGFVGTFKKLYKMRTTKFGNLVGTDQFGNEYYENTKDYQHGQHRWCEYAGDRSFYQVEPSVVPPEWHLWLHQTTDEVPTSITTGSTHRTLPQANSAGSSAPYDRNLGGVVSEYTPNLSQYRPRGYGLDNGVFPDSKPDEERYYTQPGWAVDPRNKQRWPGREKRFSLRDTPLTLRAKAAARAGVSLADLESLQEEAAAAEGAPASGSDAADELLFDNSALESAIAGALTSEEAAALSGPSEADLLAKVEQFTELVSQYEGIRSRAAEAGVVRAREVIEATEAALAILRAAQTKAAAIAADFDARGFAMAAEASSRGAATAALAHTTKAVD